MTTIPAVLSENCVFKERMGLCQNIDDKSDIGLHCIAGWAVIEIGKSALEAL